MADTDGSDLGRATKPKPVLTALWSGYAAGAGGMGLIVLHSGAPRQDLPETDYMVPPAIYGGVMSRGKGSAWVVEQGHPICPWLGGLFLKYQGKKCTARSVSDVPPSDSLVLITWFRRSEVSPAVDAVTSGGRTDDFCFQPGHKTFLCITNRQSSAGDRINAVRWEAKTEALPITVLF